MRTPAGVICGSPSLFYSSICTEHRPWREGLRARGRTHSPQRSCAGRACSEGQEPLHGSLMASGQRASRAPAQHEMPCCPRGCRGPGLTLGDSWGQAPCATLSPVFSHWGTQAKMEFNSAVSSGRQKLGSSYGRGGVSRDLERTFWSLALVCAGIWVTVHGQGSLQSQWPVTLSSPHGGCWRRLGTGGRGGFRGGL